jgi:hypothetical protein
VEGAFVSQRVNAAPTQADAATALASTQAIHPELANRKDIPLTAFDFLDGAYGATKRARAIGIGILGISLLLLSWTVFSGIQASWRVGEVLAQVEDLKNSRGSLVGEFGESIEGIPTESLLDRERTLASAFASVTNSQGNFLTLFENLRNLNAPEAQVSSIVYGSATDSAGSSSDASEDAGPTALTVEVRILVTGSSLAATVSLADRILQVPGLENVVVDLGGSGASIVAQIRLDRPPQRLIDRLVTLGVRPDADKRALNAADAAATDGAAVDAPAEQEAGS